MRKDNYFTRMKRTTGLIMAMCISVTLTAQDKPSKPANLKVDADYSLVKLSWQRSDVADTLLAEGFEGETFPPQGWSLKTTNKNDPSFTWFQFPTDEIKEAIEDYHQYIHTGEKSAWVYMDMNAPYDDGTAATQNEWLISPIVKDAAYLSFYTYIDPHILEFGQQEGFREHYYVKVSHDGGQSWDILWDARNEGNGAEGWQYVTLYLNPEEGDPMVAFQAMSDDQNSDSPLHFAWMIDDVCMTKGTAETGTESFNIYLDGKEMVTNLKRLEYTDTTTKAAGAHVYEVRGYNTLGEVESESATANVNVKEATVYPPRNVKTTYTYNESTKKYDVNVTWDAPEGERTPAYYSAYCNNAQFGYQVELGEVGQTGVSKGVYDYSISAVYLYPNSESVAVSDQVALGTRYTARDLKATHNEDGSLTLSWTAPKESEYPVKGYKLFRGNDFIKEQTNTDYTETDSPNGIYDYSVKAVYEDGFEALPATIAIANGDSVVYELPFKEDFTGGLKPGNWQVNKLYYGMKDNFLWRFDNWYDLPVTGGGFDKDFASVNCSNAGFTHVFTRMATPQLTRKSLNSNEGTFLEFDMDFNSTGSVTATVEYSTDNGYTWQELSQLEGYKTTDLAEGETCKPTHLSFNVTDLFANSTKVMFSILYNGMFSQHLAIDNLKVSNQDLTGINNAVTASAPTYSVENGALNINGNGIELVQLYKADGTLVANMKSQDKNNISIPVNGQGLYIVSIKAADGTHTMKVNVR